MFVAIATGGLWRVLWYSLALGLLVGGFSAVLRAAGVVRNRRDGRNVYYRLDDAHIATLLDLSREHLSHSQR